MAIYMWREYYPPELCFTANTAGSTVKLNKTGSPTAVTLETSTDGFTWSSYTVGSTITLSNIGDKVYWRTTSETDTTFSTSYDKYYKFVMTGSIAASGNITYLLNKNGTDTLSSYCFEYLFNDCTALTTTPDLPAMNLASHCYDYLFLGCTNITTAPTLPATTMKSYCYNQMFQNCTSLTTSPELPATTLASGCYNRMFGGCTSLTTPPELPVTTLATACYQNMFAYSGLTTAPELPATTLADYCYDSMFQGCTELEALPALPATTLTQSCYARMFNYCSKIKLSSSQTGEYQTAYRIPTTGTGTTATNWNYTMFANSGGTFTSNPSINTTYYTSNTVV